MDITLIGGGWDVPAQTACLRPFLDAAASRAAGPVPRVAFVWVDEGDGTQWGSRWIELVAKTARVEAVDLAVARGGVLDVARLADVDALFVCGGPTPAYADALTPVADGIRGLVLARGLPYAGSSAGAAVASRRAVVGGYLDGERVVCPSDSAEDLDEVTVVNGLGLVEETVDVHASAWGTLPRLAVALQHAAAGAAGLGLDEDTAWHVSETGGRVIGRNAVHRLRRDGDEVRWSMLRAGA